MKRTNKKQHLKIKDKQFREWFYMQTIQDHKSGCMIWTRSKNKSINKNGYGIVYVEGKHWLAHRMSWVLNFGTIPKGKGFHGTCVLHKCDNPSCVNPSHLFLGTNKENILDMHRKGRANFKLKPNEDQNGSKNLMAKLSEEKVLKIRSLKDWKQKDLAKKYNVSRATISLIINRKLWSHV